MIAQPLDHAVALTRANLAAKAKLRAQTVATITGIWDRMGSWRGPDVDGFAAQVVPLVAGAQRTVAATTDAYLAQVLTLAGADPGKPIDPAQFTGAAVRNVDPAVEWKRPGLEVWSALADGMNLPTAVGRGRARAQSLASTDLQLASTNAAQARLESSPHVVGYQRIPTGSHSCALCLVASTQRYHRGELMPIHPGCSCDVSPIIGATDPARVINSDLLERTRSTIRAQFGADVNVNDPAILRSHIVVHQHGEYGPTLTDAGDHFAGPAQVAA